MSLSLGVSMRRNQRGFTLVELAIVAAIMMAITISGMWTLVEQRRIDRATEQGKALLRIETGLQNYIIANHRALLNATPIAGVANEYAPTIAELAALDTSVSAGWANNLYGGGYTLSVLRLPVGCLPAACNLVGYAYMTTPIVTSDGTRSDKLAGYVIQAVGPDGGYSTTAVPATISGFNGGWTVANPFGGSAMVAVRTSYGSSTLSYFLPRDGSLPMTGNLDMGANDIINGNDISIAGHLGTNGLAASAGYPVGWAGGIHTWDAYAEGTIGAGIGGSLAATMDRNGNIWASTSISSGGNISATGDIWLGARSIWLSQVVDRMPNYVEKGGFMTTNGSIVPFPVCAAGGSPRVVVTPQNILVDPFSYKVTYYAINLGAAWQIVMLTFGNNGANSNAGSALAQTYCYFP